jgi:hypothetical protein
VTSLDFLRGRLGPPAALDATNAHQDCTELRNLYGAAALGFEIQSRHCVFVGNHCQFVIMKAEER